MGSTPTAQAQLAARPAQLLHAVDGEARPRFGNALELHNLIAKGVANQAAQGMGSELAHDLVSVGFYRVNTDPQGYPDLFVTLPFCEKLDNFSLARGQKVTIAVRSAACLAPGSGSSPPGPLQTWMRKNLCAG